MPRTTDSMTFAGRCIRLAKIAVLAAVTPLNMLGEEAAAQGLVIEPDVEMQTRIKRAMEPGTAQDWQTALEQLRTIGDKNDRQLIPQLLYYSVHGADLNSDPGGMTKDLVLQIVAERLRIPKRSIAHSLIPYIDTPDPKLKKRVYKILLRHEDASALRPPDFTLYGSIISHNFRNREELADGLVRHMYENHPGTALLTMKQAALRDLDQMRQITWAEHVIADVIWKHKHKFLDRDRIDPSATEQLDKLSRSEHWWVRLYVAEIMRQHAGFRRAEIIERLKQDANGLVHQSVRFPEKTN